jgi:cyanophycinase
MSELQHERLSCKFGILEKRRMTGFRIGHGAHSFLASIYYRAVFILAATTVGAIPCSAQTVKGNNWAAYSTPAKNSDVATASKATKTAQAPRFGAVLLGGHGDVDEATSFLCEHSGGGDLVVISAYGAGEYNSDFHAACPENSVTTLVITSAEAANDSFVVDKIHDAHAIFLSGGDQSHYVNYWTGQGVQKEINTDVARGVPLGGISAGLAVQGQFVFTAMMDTVKSPEALANPYDPHVTLVRDFLSIPVLKGVITDSHFSQRERMGRSLAFLARIVQDGWAQEAHGIGVDETTAVLVEADGHARVAGKNSAYFMTLDHRPEICVDGKPLTLRRVKVLKLSAGDKFDLKTWTATGGTTFEVNVVDGKMMRTDQP